MKALLIFLFALLLFKQADAQERLKNAAFVELGGSGYYYSVNYERSLGKGFLTRVGIGAVPGILIVPVQAGKLFGKGNHYLEITAGLTYISGETGSADVAEGAVISHQLFAAAFIGYRYQKPQKRFLFRAGYTPFFKISDTRSDFNNHFFFQWGGISFGYRF